MSDPKPLPLRPPAQQEDKLDFIDGLRGIAILLVVFYHAIYLVPGLSQRMKEMSQVLGYRVQLFFVISAFTLFMSLDRRTGAPTKAGESMWRDFFARRAFRIVPLYVVGVAFYVLWHRYSPVIPTDERHWANIGAVVSALTFTSQLFPDWINDLPPGGWSITNEVSFYLILPFLFYFVRTLHRALMLTILAIMVGWAFKMTLDYRPIWNFLCDHLPGFSNHTAETRSQFRYFTFINQLPVFMMGIATYYTYASLKKHKAVFGLDDDLTRRRWGLLLIGMAAFMMVALFDGRITLLSKHLLYGVAYCLLLLGCCLCPIRLVANRVLMAIGTISYSVYMTHFAFLAVASWMLREGYIPAVHNKVVMYVMISASVLIPTLVCSLITYKLIEVPSIELGRKYVKRLRDKANARNTSATGSTVSPIATAATAEA